MVEVDSVLGVDEDEGDEGDEVETGGRPPRLRTLMDEFARDEATSKVRGGGRATFVCSGSQRRAPAVVICWAMCSGGGGGGGGGGDDARAGAGCAVVAWSGDEDEKERERERFLRGD
jgi:hypothetical protein